MDSVDRSVFTVCTSWAEAEQHDREYWLSRPPAERLAATELTRRILYGHARCSARIRRVVEIIERPPR